VSLYPQAIACGIDPEEAQDLDEVDCGHDWDMSCPPCRRCGGCPECGDCECDYFYDEGEDMFPGEGYA
jgi:hypothetical protein